MTSYLIFVINVLLLSGCLTFSPPSLQQTLSGHSEGVESLTDLGDGLMASGAIDGSIRVWEVIKNESKYIFDRSNGGHSSVVYSLVKLSDGYLASGSADFTIKIWNLKTGALVITFDRTRGGHNSAVYSLVALETGFLASSSADMTVKVWDINILELKYTFDRTNGGHADSVKSLAVLENGFLASASLDKTVKIWDVTLGRLKSTLQGTYFCSVLFDFDFTSHTKVILIFKSNLPRMSIKLNMVKSLKVNIYTVALSHQLSVLSKYMAIIS
jgi:WD40 repeat protein